MLYMIQPPIDQYCENFIMCCSVGFQEILEQKCLEPPMGIDKACL